MIHFIPESVVLAIHDDQIRLYGGAYGVPDIAALDAALHIPQATFGGEFLHTTIFAMAAAYGFHLCQNHPFIDGNKRTAGMVMFTFLQLNGIEPNVSEPDYYSVMMSIASGQMSKEQLASWLQEMVRSTLSNNSNN